MQHFPNAVTASIDEKQSDLMKGVQEMELEQITEGYFASRNGMDEAAVLGAESPVLTILNDGIVLSNIDDNMFANKPAIQILVNMEKGVIAILPCEKDKKTKCAMELPENRQSINIYARYFSARLYNMFKLDRDYFYQLPIKYSQIGSGESIMFCGLDDAVALTPTKPLKRKAM